MKKDITENLFLVTPAAEDSEPANLRNETDLVAYDGMISGRICTLCDLCVLQITPSKHYYCTKTQKEINNTIADYRLLEDDTITVGGRTQAEMFNLKEI